MIWQAVDVAALWVGRVVLGLMVLTVATILMGMFAIGFQVVRKGWQDARKAIKKAKTKKDK